MYKGVAEATNPPVDFGGRARSIQVHRWAKLVGLAVLVMLVTTVGGCFYTAQEIIPARNAVSIPGLAGTWVRGQSKTPEIVVSEVPGSKDYRYEKGSGDYASSGYFRLLPLKDDIYIVQAKDDKGPDYTLLFYRIRKTNDGMDYAEVDANDANAQSELAKSYHVQMDFDGEAMSTTLVGSRENILNFMMAHKNLQFDDAPDN